MLIGRTTWFKKLRNAAIKANNLGIITDISHYHQDHNAFAKLIKSKTCSLPSLTSFKKGLASHMDA